MLCLVGAGFLAQIDLSDAIVKVSAPRFVAETQAATSQFGPELSTQGLLNLRLLPQQATTTGCNATEIQALVPLPSAGVFALLLQRGECDFATKVKNAQQVGAKAVIVGNTRKALFQSNVNYTAEIKYSCANGEAWIPTESSPPWAEENDSPVCQNSLRCSSKQCMLTNHSRVNTAGAQEYQVCCMFDLFTHMWAPKEDSSEIHIPSVWIPIHGNKVLQNGLSQGVATVGMYKEPQPKAESNNTGPFFLWLLAIITATGGSYIASEKERFEFKRNGGVECSSSNHGCHLCRRWFYSRAPRSLDDDGSHLVDAGYTQEEDVPSVELTMWHALGFLVSASCFLIILFYFDLIQVVNVIFCFVGFSSTIALLWFPLCACLYARFVSRSPAPNTNLPCLGEVSLIDAPAVALGLTTVIVWYLHRRSSWGWILQDIMGICLCVLFLSAIRVRSLKVASLLLVLVFFYDIFFVFISPHIFGESVMVKVATGGPQTQSKSALFCDRYPDDKECGPPESLPLLLKIPYLKGDGYSMLGFGDIVLPALLLAFTLRYDYIKMRAPFRPFSQSRSSLGGESKQRPYFVFIVFGYAVGLGFAYIAVYLMEQGQPALLYIVPCTLGLLVGLASCRGDLKELWNWPPPAEGVNAGSSFLPNSTDAAANQGGVDSATNMTDIVSNHGTEASGEDGNEHRTI